MLFNMMDIGNDGFITIEAFQVWWLSGQRSPEKYAVIIQNNESQKLKEPSVPNKLEQFEPTGEVSAFAFGLEEQK